MKFHHIHYKHHHMHHHNNSIALVICGIVLQNISVFLFLEYLAQLTFMMGTIVIMLGLYMLKHSKKEYIDPVKSVIVLLLFSTIVFLIFNTLEAFLIYIIFSIYLFLIFDIKKIHLGLR